LDPYFIGYRFAMAILDIKAHPLVELLSDRVGPANHEKLLRNGATAK
jgi:hypothetical protein